MLRADRVRGVARGGDARRARIVAKAPRDAARPRRSRAIADGDRRAARRDPRGERARPRRGRRGRLSAAMLDRLTLDDARIDGARARGARDRRGARAASAAIERTEIRPNGLEVSRVRIPLGVIAMIYEARPERDRPTRRRCASRPATRASCAAAARRSRSNRALLARRRRPGSPRAGLPADAVQLVPIDRSRGDRRARASSTT